MINKERAVRRPPPQENTPRPSTQQPQFNATPRFHFSSTPRPTPSQNLPRATPAPSRYLTPASKAAGKDVDAIDSSFEDLPSDDVHKSIETGRSEIDIEDVGYTSADLEDGGHDHVEERSPKRRRISTSPAIEDDEALDHRDDEGGDEDPENLSSSLPILSSPPAPRRPVSTTAPRFLLSTPAPPSTPHPTSTAQTHTFLKPPRFRAPEPSEQTQQGDPLPEQFSPHRKGQKYVAGGLAAEMRDWLVNIESTIPTPAQETRREDGWLVKLVVDEVSGNSRAGMTLVRGRQVHGLEGGGEMTDTIGVTRVILAGEGAANGLQRASAVEVGKRVGIKGPVWEVVVEGERWGVGVEWKVLS